MSWDLLTAGWCLDGILVLGVFVARPSLFYTAAPPGLGNVTAVLSLASDVCCFADDADSPYDAIDCCPTGHSSLPSGPSFRSQEWWMDCYLVGQVMKPPR